MEDIRSSFYDIFTYESINLQTTVDTTYENCIYKNKQYFSITVNTGSVEDENLFNMVLVSKQNNIESIEQVVPLKIVLNDDNYFTIKTGEICASHPY
tara:strand:+ start:44 stop:334 length:291 start_codon:yes stop_codon:yes gene_type:complete